MPTILTFNHMHAQQTAEPTVPHSLRTLHLRGRNKLGLTTPIHSPDGYFANDEALIRAWQRPESTIPPSLSHRRRSKQEDFGLHDVQEEDIMNADPAHAWRRPTRHDSRSPCPILNTAANHGYLPRSGRDLDVWTIMKALRQCYNISWGIAASFTIGGILILRLGGVGHGWLNPKIDLEDLAVHGVLEHDASMTHRDVGEFDPDVRRSSQGRLSPSPIRSRSASSASSTMVSPSSSSFPTLSRLTSLWMAVFISIPIYILSLLPIKLPASLKPNARSHARLLAPIHPSPTLIRALLADSSSGTHLTFSDVARARVRRLASVPHAHHSLPRHLKQFADADFTLLVGVFGEHIQRENVGAVKKVIQEEDVNRKRSSSKNAELGIPLPLLRTFLEDERLPSGWKPPRELGFFENHRNVVKVQQMMDGLTRYKTGKEVRTVLCE